MPEVTDLLFLFASSPFVRYSFLDGSIDERLPPFLFWNDDPFELPQRYEPRPTSPEMIEGPLRTIPVPVLLL